MRDEQMSYGVIELLLLCTIALTSACGKKPPTGPAEESKEEDLMAKSASELVQSGWRSFADKRYERGRQYFAAAWRKQGLSDSLKLEIQDGLGWCEGKLDRVDSSEIMFTQVIDALPDSATGLDSIRYECIAGLAFALSAKWEDSGLEENLYLSNEHALTVLENVQARGDSTWEHRFDPSINWKDLRLVRALNFFRLGFIDSCIAEIRMAGYQCTGCGSGSPDSVRTVVTILGILSNGP